MNSPPTIFGSSCLFNEIAGGAGGRGIALSTEAMRIFPANESQLYISQQMGALSLLRRIK